MQVFRTYVISLHCEQRSCDGITKLLNLTARMQLGLHPIKVQAVRIPCPACQWRLTLTSGDHLRDNVDSGPSIQAVGDVFFVQLEHHAGQHHDLRDVREGGPQHLLQWLLQLDEQTWLVVITAGSDRYNRPVEERMESVVLIVVEVRVQDWIARRRHLAIALAQVYQTSACCGFFGLVWSLGSVMPMASYWASFALAMSNSFTISSIRMRIAGLAWFPQSHAHLLLPTVIARSLHSRLMLRPSGHGTRVRQIRIQRQCPPRSISVPAKLADGRCYLVNLASSLSFPVAERSSRRTPTDRTDVLRARRLMQNVAVAVAGGVEGGSSMPAHVFARRR
ncbi:hypothetical protein KC341_g69 [Hortaea werneckii]|nr:hypothetical protein KC341_g69 [Hortaea werneckii]